MAKTQYYTATSIDGFIAAPGNSLDWLLEIGSGDAVGDRFASFIAGVGAMAMGATTYEWVLSHERLLDDPSSWQKYYGGIPCWVFTHRPLPAVPGAALTFSQGSVRDAHQQMTAAAGGRNIWLVGGGDRPASSPTRACSTRSCSVSPRSPWARAPRCCRGGCSPPS